MRSKPFNINNKKRKNRRVKKKLADKKNNIIILHKPHPGNIVKQYAIRQVIEHLKEKGYIKDE